MQGQSPYTMTSYGTTITCTLIVLFYAVDIFIVIAIDITTLGKCIFCFKFSYNLVFYVESTSSDKNR